MIRFEDIDARLDGIGKNREWLVTASGRSAGSVRSALAPNASAQHRSSKLQKALSDAIEREEAAQRQASESAAIEEIKQHAITIYPTRDQFRLWTRAFKQSSAEDMEQWAESGLDRLADEWLKSLESPKIVPLPARPHIVAAAGSPLGAEVEEWDGADNTVRVRISGLSMVPLLNDHDVITMHHRRAARSQYMKKGLIYLVAYQDGYTVKRYNTRVATDEEIGAGVSYVSKADGRTKVHLLESLNPSFPEIVIKDHAEWIAWIEPKELKK